MIKPNELRIGNKIYLELGLPGLNIHEVMGQDIADIANGRITLSTIGGIPLTEEWLKKMGFKDATNGYRATGAVGGVWRISSPLRGQYIDLYEKYEFQKGGVTGYFLGHFEYVMTSVHQLQNLYFAVTGEELTIKETV